eukprot:CAMPEP_0119314172 /NCGR_PEP_ID=MMETSP1333-20130426/31965_1 /TAXON_ID=418940 /ORGANISM="Scyphosphaera apsteinii, Strain RCC1455" /LENGTH=910 /DNA_ID=CAMNT_0007319233 /DNA_START=48 /DNA_END=2780 /DNA_ORIENTATION=+
MAPKRARPSRANPNPDDDDGSSPATPSEAASPAEGLPDASPLLQQPVDEDDEGEELIGDEMGADYRPMGALDDYEADGLDDADYAPMGAAQRLAAEEEIARRQPQTQSRMPKGLLTPEGDEDDERPRRRRREEPAEGEPAEAAALDDMFDEDQDHINLEDYNGPLADWIQSSAVSEEVRRRFKRFLVQFDPSQSMESDTKSKYSQRIRNMCAANEESLEVNYLHLTNYVPILAIWVADAPTEMLSLLDEAAMDVVRIMFPDYDKIHQHVHVRITDLPIEDSIRDLRQVHMNCLVKVSGVVTRRSNVFPQLKVCKYTCSNCGYVLGPFSISGNEPRMAGTQCPACQAKGPYTLNTEQTVYCNYQKVHLQESPGSVPPGRLPRHKEVIMTWDLIDKVRPGEQIEVTGVYNTSFDASLNRVSGFPVFSTAIAANYVQKKEDANLHTLTDEDHREIIKLSKDPKIRQRIVASMAPSICGHDNIKTAIALSMFGGQPKNVNNKHTIRGDINVLLIGDPGTAKSQFLKYAQKTSPRAVYTTGQGASAVGLTAAVHKDPITREYILEGGALVLADKGVCLIDEFDKMNDGDRTSIHEAMEQQSISISKAGIVTSLKARCAVIAAANPIKGRYDPAVSFMENVDLSEPILSRFDCICVVRDEVNPIEDERLAEFVVDSHKRCHPNAEEGAVEGESGAARLHASKVEVIEQDLLRKYIMYARQHTRPVLVDIDEDKITQVYSEMRSMSASGGVSVAVRHIESIIRMAEASARMHLRNHVRNDDVDLAIQVLLGAFINAQKFAIKRQMERKFSKYLVQAKDSNQLLDFNLRMLFQRAVELHAVQHRTTPVVVDVEEFEAKAREVGIEDLSTYYASDTFCGDATSQFRFEFSRDASGRGVILRASDLEAFQAATAEQQQTS